MNKRYYKILHGFGPEDSIEIEESEVQKAYVAFLQKKDAVYSGGAIKGERIIEIKPDFHRTMGWNRGYSLGSDDFEELSQKGIDRKMQHFLAEAKDKVQYLISTNQLHLLGTNFELPKVSNTFSEEVKQLADSKRIK